MTFWSYQTPMLIYSIRKYLSTRGSMRVVTSGHFYTRLNFIRSHYVTCPHLSIKNEIFTFVRVNHRAIKLTEFNGGYFIYFFYYNIIFECTFRLSEWWAARVVNHLKRSKIVRCVCRSENLSFIKIVLQFLRSHFTFGTVFTLPSSRTFAVIGSIFGNSTWSPI